MSRLLGSLFGFRPWRPSTWPSVGALIALLPVAPVLTIYELPKTLLQSLAPTLTCARFTWFLVAAITVRVLFFIKQRRERLKIFERGRVPNIAERANLLSGNLFEMIVPLKNVQIMHEQHKLLGKTWGMFYGPDPWIWTTDLELLRHIFVLEGNKYVNSTEYRLPFTTEMNASLAGVQGDEWRRARRILQPPFAHKHMQSDNVFADIERAVDKLLASIAAHPLEQNGSEGASRIVDIEHSFKKLTSEVIFSVAYGAERCVNWAPAERDSLLEMIHEAAKMIRGPLVWTSIMFECAQSILGQLVPLSPIGKYISHIHALLDERLYERRKMMREGRIKANDRRMIDSIIESSATNKMNDEELKANLFFIFISGFETTANTLALFFFLMARHQEAQEKLRAALARDGERAEYLDWCIQETLRLWPAVPSGVGRVMVEDLEHDGMTFFKGCVVNANIYSIHHSAELWGADVEEFRPERFAEPLKHPLQMFAFGHGPRMCLGYYLARHELRATIPRIVLKYKLSPCASTPEQPDAVSPNLVHWIIHGPLNVRFTELTSL